MPDLTNRQHELTQRVRDIDSQIIHLRSARRAAVEELERIYPQARSTAPLPIPPVQGVVLSVFNYAREGYTGRVNTTPAGIKVANSPISSNVLNQLLLTLCNRPNGADIEKLLALPVLKDEPNIRRVVYKLVRDGYLHATYTMVLPVSMEVTA